MIQMASAVKPRLVVPKDRLVPLLMPVLICVSMMNASSPMAALADDLSHVAHESNPA
jgi:hypothetical protein